MNRLNGREDLSSFVWPLDYLTLTQSNGQAKHTVHTVKSLLHNAKGPHMALLSYRAVPLEWCGLTPAELLMCHQIRTGLPHPKSSYVPIWTHIQNLKEFHEKYQSRQEKYCNNQHHIKTLQSLPDNTPIWIQTEST